MTSPTNLPHPLTSFIGRAREIADVTRLLAGARLLTLTGSGGCGKTRLALQVAAGLQDRFPQGVYFVALAPLDDPDLVLPTIAGVLGVPESGGVPLATILQNYLREKTLLLLLDNCEQIAAAGPALADLLAASPGLRVLATSRAALHLYGEQEFLVPPLALPEAGPGDPGATPAESEAVQLFVARARDVQPAFVLTPETAPAVAEICRRLDGLPLAIELAAARVKILSPPAMLARFAPLQLLTGGARDLPARQQTLRGAIAWSYDLLTADDQQLFRRLGVFVGGCTLDAAEQVAGGEGPPAGDAPAFHTLDGLAALVDQSLLRRRDTAEGEPRFGMLETIREYALEQLRAAGEAAAVRARHAAYYLALARTVALELRGPRQVAWLEYLEGEHDNLRAALTWALEQGAAGTALPMVEALAWFWSLRGYLAEGRAWIERTLALPGAAARTATRARVLNWAGALAYRQSALGPARTLLQEGESIFVEVGEDSGRAYSLTLGGVVTLYSGDPAGAWAPLEESVRLFRRTPDRWGLGLALRNWGEAAQARGDQAARRALLEESVQIFRAVGDNWGCALALNSLGAVERDVGANGRAAALFAESLAMFRALGDKQGLAWGLAQLAGVAGGAGDPERAARLFGVAATLLAAISARLDPVDRAQYDQDLAATRARLTPETFAAAWQEGAALPLDTALALAVTPLASSAPAAPAGGNTGPDALTPREIEVLRLVAAGLTDAQVAQHLAVSPRTVQTHVRSIYSKLGLTTRSAATRYAMEHGFL